eukprot:CAMPEP_0172499476 /NCGR_PEP_ID=MMETSP1066-20121228/127774_1 /TAXON_ID=671091 /ORGANISM="Coscinodiscus wailesii, Strain CCMP2513" /LENGTH=198 /DNA_ID=CAMNT_0013273251 /DNA_START=55 /DNA_END=647 /DNA_ORIENTATION=-
MAKPPPSSFLINALLLLPILLIKGFVPPPPIHHPPHNHYLLSPSRDTTPTTPPTPTNNNNTAATTTTSDYSFFDEATIYIRAGSGGAGSPTYKKGPNGQNGAPDGGNGGAGGSIYLLPDEGLNTLAGLSNAWRPNTFGGSGKSKSSSTNKKKDWIASFKAENGRDGSRGYKTGRNGEDLYVRVPVGTVVRDDETGREV